MGAIKKLLRRVTTWHLLAIAVIVALLAGLAALLQWWGAAVIGVIGLQLITIAIALRASTRPLGGRAASAKARPAPLLALEQKLDRMGARMLESQERTRTDLLTALDNRDRADEPEPGRGPVSP